VLVAHAGHGLCGDGASEPVAGAQANVGAARGQRLVGERFQLLCLPFCGLLKSSSG